MSKIFVDQVDPKTATTLTLGTSGDTVDVPSGVTLDISSATLTPPATMPASSGVNLTALNASALGSGTVPTARLGTGTASSSTVLYGDQTYKAEPGGGKVLQILFDSALIANTSTSDSWADIPDPAITITPASTSSKFQIVAGSNYFNANSAWAFWSFRRAIDGGATTDDLANAGGSGSYGIAKSDDSHNRSWSLTYVDEPSTTSDVTYTMIFKSTSSHTIYTGTAADRTFIYVIEYES